ncbi:hypothetical protein KAH81_07135 [bacterium]|nr:hypothetical protein [bacterium]
MRKTTYLTFIVVLASLLGLSCSQIPEDYTPSQYNKIAVFAVYQEFEEIDIDSGKDLIESIVKIVGEAIVGDYPEWDATSEMALISVRCGYDVYLVGPEDYFDDRNNAVEVQHQKRYMSAIPDDYNKYIREMKSMIGPNMQPVAYLTGYILDNETDDIQIEMRRWETDRKIFSMNYKYFLKHYNEFYCGADIKNN